MKCREKLKKEHPDCVGETFMGGCNLCPINYGYLPPPETCATQPITDEMCSECWDREIPEPKPEPVGVVYWKDGHTEGIDEYIKHTENWIEFHAESGAYLYKPTYDGDTTFYKRVEMDEWLPVDIKGIDIYEYKNGYQSSKLNTEIDIHKLIDECMEKKDRYITIFTSELGTSVSVYPMADEDEDNDSN